MPQITAVLLYPHKPPSSPQQQQQQQQQQQISHNKFTGQYESITPDNTQQQLTANTNLSPQKISSPQQQQQLTATTNISSPKIIPPQQQQQQQPTGVDTISPQKISSQQQQQPTGVDTISPQKISSSQQQQQSPLPPITTLKEPPPVNRILDFSTPPKPTAANSSPLSLTPFKPLDTTQDKPAPNMNPFIDPSYPSKVSPDKQTVTSANEPSSPPHDPRSPKSRSDMQLLVWEEWRSLGYGSQVGAL